MHSDYVINTASGALLDLAEPDPAAILLEDIAAALSKVCRFGAQTSHFYSVAQHVVLVQRLVVEAGNPELSLAALHHDSHEAFVGDVTTPLKRMLGRQYEEVCARLDHAIGQALGIELPLKGSAEAEPIKLADDQALEIEGVQLLPNWTRDGKSHVDLPALESPLLPEDAELLFLRAHRRASLASLDGGRSKPRDSW